MNVLMTGASSLLGWELLRHAPPEWRITGTVHRNPDLPPDAMPHRVVQLDISDKAAVETVVGEAAPDIVIHTASHGNLDFCENHPAEAVKINVDGTGNLLEASARFSAAFLFTSTMYVFDGAHPPYDESAAPNPVNYYGASKLEAERLVSRLNARSVILRPMTLYGWHSPRQRANWVTWLLDRMSRGESTHVVSDVISNHLWVGDAAAAVIAAVRRQATGIFHLGGPENHSRYEFSAEVARTFGYPSTLLIPVGSEYFPQLARRPGAAVCSTAKMQEVLGVHPLGTREGLAAMRQIMRSFGPSWNIADDVTERSRVASSNAG